MFRLLEEGIYEGHTRTGNSVKDCAWVELKDCAWLELKYPPRRYPYFDVVVGRVWSHDPKSYAGGSVCYS
jgi:hypothetical protein